MEGGNSGQEEIKMASAITPSANEQAKDLILVHTVQLKPMIKAQISGRMISSGISDVVIASVHSEKTRLKKLIMIIITRKMVSITGRETSFLKIFVYENSIQIKSKSNPFLFLLFFLPLSPGPT